MDPLTVTLTDQQGRRVKSWCSSQGPIAIGRGSRTKSSMTSSTHSGLFRTDGTKVMSQTHATLTWTDHHAFLSDAASTNGTFIVNDGDEDPIKLKQNVPYRLKEGDRITFGKAMAEPGAASVSTYTPLTVTVSLRYSSSSAPATSHNRDVRTASAEAPELARSRTATRFVDTVDLISSDEDLFPRERSRRRLPIGRRSVGRFGLTESELFDSGDDTGSFIVCDDDDEARSRQSSQDSDHMPSDEEEEDVETPHEEQIEIQSEAMQSDSSSPMPSRLASPFALERQGLGLPEDARRGYPSPSMMSGNEHSLIENRDNSTNSSWPMFQSAEASASQRRSTRGMKDELSIARLPSPISPEQTCDKVLRTARTTSMHEFMHDSGSTHHEVRSPSAEFSSQWTPPARPFNPVDDPSVQYFTRLVSESHDTDEHASSHLPSPVASLEGDSRSGVELDIHSKVERDSMQFEKDAKPSHSAEVVSSDRGQHVNHGTSRDRPSSPSPEELEALHFSLQSSQERRELWDASTQVRKELEVEYGAGYMEQEQDDGGEQDMWLDEEEVDRDQSHQPGKGDEIVEVDCFGEERDDFDGDAEEDEDDLDLDGAVDNVDGEEFASDKGDDGEKELLEVPETIESVPPEEVIPANTSDASIGSESAGPGEVVIERSFSSTRPVPLLNTKRPISAVDDTLTEPEGCYDATMSHALVAQDDNPFDPCTINTGAVAHASAQTMRPIAPLPKRAGSIKRTSAIVATSFVAGLIATVAGLSAFETAYEAAA